MDCHNFRPKALTPDVHINVCDTEVYLQRGVSGMLQRHGVVLAVEMQPLTRMRVDLLGGAAQTLNVEIGGQSDYVPGQTSGHSSPDLYTSNPQTKMSVVMRPPVVEPVIFPLCGHRLRMKTFVHMTGNSCSSDIFKPFFKPLKWP